MRESGGFHGHATASIMTAQVQFDNCAVPLENLVGEEGQGFKYAMAGLDGGRLNIAACALGGAENKTLFLLSSTDAYPERLRGTKHSRVDTLTVDVAGTGPLDREVHHH